MDILTKESLDAAIEECREINGYYVLICTKYAESHRKVSDYLSKVDGICGLTTSRAYFENGSSIRMVSLNSNVRGYRVDLCLYEDAIGDSTALELLSVLESRGNFLME